MRAWVRCAPPLLACLAVLDLFALDVWSASYAPLGRDQGIFQYTAFATRAGEQLYRDIREVNGPLTHLVHRCFLALGGAETHRFRTLDWVVTLLVYAGVGASVPRLLATGLPRWAYASLGVIVLGTQYLCYLGWDQAQRESFAMWLVLPALVLAVRPQNTWKMHAIVGALGAAACFGKPTMGAFVPLYGLAAWGGTSARASTRVRHVLALAAGALGGAALVLLATALWLGDPWAGLRLSFVEAPALYAELFRRSPGEILSLPWLRVPLSSGIGVSALASLALALGWLPRRLWPLALAPLAGLLAMFVQGKGYLYHAHPITAPAWLLVLVMFAALHARAVAAPAVEVGAPSTKVLAALTSTVMVLGWCVYARALLIRTPAYFARDLLHIDAEERSPARLDRAEMHDFHPYAMATIAAWLDAHTAKDARVQIYGTDPLVLFWAQRLGATPYLYEYDLNITHAVAGARAHGRDATTILAMGARHGADALARLEQHPPAAFVLFDGAPFMSEPTALADLSLAQPAIAAFLQAHYRPLETFDGPVHLWVRSAP